MNAYTIAQNIIKEVSKAVIGKEECISKTLCALLAGGHVLLEDIPGVGKTTMAMAFAKTMQMYSKRVQFTPDVMPSDIVGYKLYRQDTKTFEYQAGAAVCNLFLADEINRTSPKTQSALLEVMEEGRLSVEGEVFELPKPFLVIATQNPFGSAGTQRLPESQLDRFLICLSMGYPSLADELAIVKGKCNTIPLDEIQPVISREEVCALQEEAARVFMDDKVYAYIGALVTATRCHKDIALGLSPRATIALAKMAQAMALVNGRDYVIPEDVSSVFADVAAHRLHLQMSLEDDTKSRRELCQNILDKVEAPGVL